MAATRSNGEGKGIVNVFPDLETLSRSAAEEVARVIGDAVAQRGACAVALSGGNTPRSLYRLLGGAYRDRIPWDDVDLFWGDERYVPPQDPASNFRMVKETLLDVAPIAPARVHAMPTGFADPGDGAREYEAVLERHFGSRWPRFDLLLLGLAADGHIASLFPGSAALRETERRVVAVRVPKDPPQRLTLTLPAINHAAHVHFLVAGKTKAGALHRALVGPCDVHTCPAVGVKPTEGRVTWWVDEAAATFLSAAVRGQAPSR